MTRLLQAVLGATVALYLAIFSVHIAYIGPPWGSTAALDFRLTGYAPSQASLFLDGLDAAGRWAYFDVLRVLDTVFPACFAAAMILIYRGLNPSGTYRGLGLLAAAALGYMGADYAENARIAVLQTDLQPDVFSAAAKQASQATVLKFALIGIAIVMILVRIFKQVKTLAEQERR